jgi:transglutaminase-like putative cysteine protease
MDKRKLLYVTLLAFSLTEIYAQDYSVALIPDSLKTDARYVIRDDTRELELQTVNCGTEKIKRVLTILDKEGENMAYLVVPYDRNSTVNIKQITLFDSNGKKTKNVKQSEITDSPAYNTSELFSEDRIKYYKPINPVYPYTIEYDYEINMKNIISFGCWQPFNNYNVSTQHTRLAFSYPAKVKINKKEINVYSKTSERHSDVIVETWELNNLKAIEYEPFGIGIHERMPCVYLMPAHLDYDKFEGSSDNWAEYGKWLYSLYQGRDSISEIEKNKIATLVKEVSDTIERIKALYRYLQGNTRYVNISLGIGGFQPIDAKTVYKTGYGDCKALTNYMYSLLELIGIKSYPAIVSSGRYKEPIFTDFPNFQQFDHVILCVPNSPDTLWLECTNQKIPFGFLGDFTDDREVLLITEQGGKFAHTRKYEANDNIKSCRSEFNIDSTGTAICSVRTFYQGLQYDDISELLSLNYDEQKKWLYSNSTLPSLLIKDFSVNDLKGALPIARTYESSISKNYCSFSGKYMLLPLNVLNPQKSIPKMLKPRYSDILINRSSVEYDTMVYKIPKNFRYEFIPSEATINSDFGSYSSSVSANEKEIIYIRKFTILEGRYKPSCYKELYEFILAASKADNSKMILTKKI